MLSNLLFSCSDKLELNEISLVIGIAIDKNYNNNNIIVTLELANPNLGSQQDSKADASNQSLLEESEGKNFADALQNFTKTNSQVIDFSHIQVIIMSKAICIDGVSEIIDYVARDRQFRNLNWLFMAEDTAKNVLKEKFSSDDITSLGLAKMMEKLRSNGSIVPIDINRFIIGLESQSKTSLLPIIEIETKANVPKGKIKVGKTAVFKNNHLTGIFSEEESKLLVWFYRRIKGNLIVSPISPASNGIYITLKVYKEDTKITANFKNEEVEFDIKCVATAEIKELHNLKLNPLLIKRLETNTEQVLNLQLVELINKCQTNFNSDVLGFAEIIYNNTPEKWIAMKEHWYDIFPNIKYKVSFDVDIKNAGMIKNSPDEVNEGGK
jgi:spore germination protein KC